MQCATPHPQLSESPGITQQCRWDLELTLNHGTKVSEGGPQESDFLLMSIFCAVCGKIGNRLSTGGGVGGRLGELSTFKCSKGALLCLTSSREGLRIPQPATPSPAHRHTTHHLLKPREKVQRRSPPIPWTSLPVCERRWRLRAVWLGKVRLHSLQI